MVGETQVNDRWLMLQREEEQMGGILYGLGLVQALVDVEEKLAG